MSHSPGNSGDRATRTSGAGAGGYARRQRDRIFDQHRSTPGRAHELCAPERAADQKTLEQGACDKRPPPLPRPREIQASWRTDCSAKMDTPFPTSARCSHSRGARRGHTRARRCTDRHRESFFFPIRVMIDNSPLIPAAHALCFRPIPAAAGSQTPAAPCLQRCNPLASAAKTRPRARAQTPMATHVSAVKLSTDEERGAQGRNGGTRDSGRARAPIYAVPSSSPIPDNNSTSARGVAA